MVLKDVNFFVVYYEICWYGVIDLAKLEVLKNNRKIGANLYLTMLALQQLFQGAFMEPWLKYIAAKPWAWCILAFIINLICLPNFKGLFQLETQEINKLKKLKR